MNFTTAFERTVARHPWKPALLLEDDRSVSYGELDERTTQLANALNERAPDGRVATLALNGPLAIETMIASQKRGLGNVQLPFRDPADALVSMLEGPDPEVLLFDDANVETALAVLERREFEAVLHAGERDVDHEAVESYEAAVSAASTTAVDPAPEREHGVFYTSGTTTTPKAVLFDQEQMWYGSTQVVMEHGIDETDTALVNTPWYHMVTTDAWILPHLHAGATLVVQSEFDPVETLRMVDEHDVTGLLAVPTQLHTLADVQANEGFDLESLDYLRTGGSIVSETIVEKTTEYLSPNLYNTYGLTEGGPNLTFAHPTHQDEHTGTIGKESFMWDVRVVEAVDPDEEPDPDAVVEPGESGEVIGRCPGMSEGYVDNPSATEDLFADGWLRTGDVAELDEDGFLYIIGRVDNMLISGGENVYPEEVEEVVETHDDVEEAVVVGLEDEQWGHKVACVVRLADSSTVDADDLDQYCKDHEQIANFKRPREYVLIDDELPRTDTGTIQREDVYDEFFG